MKATAFLVQKCVTPRMFYSTSVNCECVYVWVFADLIYGDGEGHPLLKA